MPPKNTPYTTEIKIGDTYYKDIIGESEVVDECYISEDEPIPIITNDSEFSIELEVPNHFYRRLCMLACMNICANNRVKHLATYSKKARVRNKNCNRMVYVVMKQIDRLPI